MSKDLSITFRRFPQDLPSEGEGIFYIDSSEFYGSYGIQYAEVEYSWEEVDEDGEPTGTTYFTDSGDEPPEGCRIVVGLNGVEMRDGCLWCPADEVDAMLENAGEKRR